jgi:hypothetical protein
MNKKLKNIAYFPLSTIVLVFITALQDQPHFERHTLIVIMMARVKTPVKKVSYVDDLHGVALYRGHNIRACDTSQTYL